MDSTQTPKKRLVIYVTETAYNDIKGLAAAEKGSISSKAEEILMKGFVAISSTLNDKHSTAQTVTPEAIQESIIDVFTNLPDDKLEAISTRLIGILERHAPERLGKIQYTPALSPDIPKATVKTPGDSIQELAQRISDFLVKTGHSQRTFKQTFGLDITHLKKWKEGLIGMSPANREKFERVLAGGTTV